MAIKRKKTKKRATYGSGAGKTRSKGRATAMKRVSRPAKRTVKKGAAARPPARRPGGGKP